MENPVWTQMDPEVLLMYILWKIQG
jgi:hypothetical protein